MIAFLDDESGTTFAPVIDQCYDELFPLFVSFPLGTRTSSITGSVRRHYAWSIPQQAAKHTNDSYPPSHWQGLVFGSASHTLSIWINGALVMYPSSA
jgi:hypothetical protein